MSEQIPENEQQPVDLSVDAEAFSAPGDGASAESDDVGKVDMITTYGTTCWGTPCPSNNTYSC